MTLIASFSDPGRADTHTYLWEVTTDNGQAIPAGTEPTFAFTPVDEGIYTVRLTVTDDEGDAGSDEVVVTVRNVAPQNVSAGPDMAVEEGTAVSLTAGFADPGPLDAHTYLWQVTTENGQLLPDGTDAAFGFTPVDEGVYTVTLTVTDDDGGVGTKTTVVTVRNAARDVYAGEDLTVGEGTLVWLTSSFLDPGILDTHTFSWVVVSNNGDIVPVGSAPAFQFQARNDGNYTVTLTVRDNAGDAAQDVVVVTATNLAPVDVDAGPDRTVPEGNEVQLASSHRDPGVLDMHTFRWHVTANNGEEIPDGTDASFTFVPRDNGIYEVTFTVTDDHGAAASDTTIVTVQNVVPTVDLGPDREAVEGDLVELAAHVTDPGDDVLTYFWQVFTTNGQSVPSGSGVEFSFPVADDGTYVVRLTVADDDRGSAYDTLVVSGLNIVPQNIVVDYRLSDLLSGCLVTVEGTFTDPGADRWRRYR